MVGAAVQDLQSLQSGVPTTQIAKKIPFITMSQPIGPSLPIPPSNKNKPEVDNSKIIGPALPPHILNKLHDQSVTSSTSNDDNENHKNEKLEKALTSQVKTAVIGPTLPPHLLNKTNTSEENSSDDESVEIVTPILPTTSSKENLETSTNIESTNLPDSSSDASYGPALPPHLQRASVQEDSDDDSEDAYGPLPPGVSTSSQVYQALEERALQIKLGQLDPNEDKGTVREEWMMALPDVHAKNLGLGPRQFRKNQRPDFSDRSSWTDTPQDKAKKLQGKVETKIDLKKEAELQEIDKRDDEQRRLAEKHNRKKKRDKSLLEMHQDKLKKKKKEDKEEGTTRRPFSREVDLQVNRFDDAQKKSIIKKAMHLDDRFSKGQSKFL